MALQPKKKIEVHMPDLPKINVKEKLTNVIKSVKTSVITPSILKFKGIIIHAWLEDFEDQYLKTFKQIPVVDTTDPKEVINSIYQRMAECDYSIEIMVITKYDPENGFILLSTMTPKELEYTEFLKWKKLKDGGK